MPRKKKTTPLPPTTSVKGMKETITCPFHGNHEGLKCLDCFPPQKVKLVSYSIKMVIPTGAYANIQPEIIVEAETPEQAESYIAPHMNRLWKEYFMISERRPETPAPKPVETEQKPPASSVAFTKATQAIGACLTMDALDVITAQVKKSTKLTDPDKDKLMVLIITKIKEFRGADTK